MSAAPELVRPRVPKGFAKGSALYEALARGVDRDEDDFVEHRGDDGEPHRKHDVTAVRFLGRVAVDAEAEHGLDLAPRGGAWFVAAVFAFRAP